MKSLIYTLLKTDSTFGPLVARLFLAVVIFPHGAQKVLGWFGGYGLSGTLKFFNEPFHISTPLALLGFAAEFLAPLPLLAGFGSRLAAMSIAVTMVVAMKFHPTRCGEALDQRLHVKAAGPGQVISELSGDNQQKLGIARVLHQEAQVLLLDEPTRGIDVGTKSEIYRLMGELAAEGKGIIFVSSYLPELLAMCDRIAVMSRGRLRDVRPTISWTEESIMAAAIQAEE